MTIESTRAPEGAKTSATGTSATTSRPGQTAKSAGGFASVMSLLAAADAPSQATDAALAPVGAAPDALSKEEQNQPLALLETGLVDMSSIASMLGQMAAADPSKTAAEAAQQPAGTAADTLEKDDKNQPLAFSGIGLNAMDFMSGMLGQPGVMAATPHAKGVKSAAPGAVDSLQGAASGTAQPSKAQALEASAGQTPLSDQAQNTRQLLDHRRAAQAQGLSSVQTELREVKALASLQASATAPELGRVALATLATPLLPNVPERPASKSQPGLAGAEGLFGSALADRLGINPTYEVASASAVVPEGQVAETVSYWASQGVQSAELTLDGLGDEPVEVRISIEGDQAQIDFRSNQPEVRQVLEAASAQLKALLSGEGLQLTGMSVGTSGRGGQQGEGDQPKPSARQAKVVSTEPVRASRTPGTNPAVGQALDLYV